MDVNNVVDNIEFKQFEKENVISIVAKKVEDILEFYSFESFFS